MFAGLVSSRRKAKVRGYRARTFEPTGVIHCGLEGQGSNGADTRHSHHPHADLILRRRTLHTAIQLEIVLKEDRAGIKQWNDRMSENFIHLDHGPHEAVKAAVLHSSWQTNTEDLQQPRTSLAKSIVFFSKAFLVLSNARIPCASRLFMCTGLNQPVRSI